MQSALLVEASRKRVCHTACQPLLGANNSNHSLPHFAFFISCVLKASCHVTVKKIVPNQADWSLKQWHHASCVMQAELQARVVTCAVAI